MPRPRAPWWLYVMAASYVTILGLLLYTNFLGPEEVGIQAASGERGMVLRAVALDSAAGRAGLLPGDRLLAINEAPVRVRVDLLTWRANMEVGRAQQWYIERGNQRLRLAVIPVRVSPGRWETGEQFSAFLGLAFRIITLVLAFIIAFSQPQSSVALMGAWLLAFLATSAPAPTPGAAVAWRHLPLPLAALVWIAGVSFPMSGAVIFTFFANFPRKLFRARWPWFVVWMPAAALGLCVAVYYYFMLYDPPVASHTPAWFVWIIAGLTLGYGLGGLVVLVVNYRRVEEVNERRRLDLIVIGALVTVLPRLTFALTFYFPPSPASIVAGATKALSLALPVLSLAFPLAMAHAILRHRLFDIRVMIRQGLQYALARRVVVSAAPAVAGMLLLDLLLHRDQPPEAVLRARAWFYITLGVLAVLAYMRRQVWLGALDRRFFRERYDAQRLLREVIEHIRQAGSFERVAPRVVAQIEAALHPEFVAILLREPRERFFRTLASAPAGQAPAPLSVDSKLVAFVRVLGKALDVSLSGASWLKQQLPHQETEFLRQARIEWLVPVAMAAERTEALLALGPKRSEEPYSHEDQDWLAAIASGLSLLAEKPAAPITVKSAFEECPQCGACYDSGVERCEREGAALAPVRLPRLLASRYRLEQRLGRGGMGAVYEATDTALERQVAVKVIRDELVGSRDAAERFRREARIAAGFSHPNVVTIHDFGVVADTRAFLVMELLHGQTLRQRLQDEKRLAPGRALGILSGVCAALDAAHRRSLIHRDLKPENVFLVGGETPAVTKVLDAGLAKSAPVADTESTAAGTRGEPPEVTKVLDFGLAKFLPGADSESTAATSPGVLVGTLHYMPPEQLRGEAVQASWDLWALAVMTYEMLAGAPPFELATAAEWHGAVLAGRFTPLARHLPQAPGSWQEFFDRALALEQQRRPDSARAFLAALEAALG